MPDLTQQAEAAVLAAVLRDPRLLDEVPYLTAGDFTGPRHLALFAAITRTRIAHPDATAPRRHVLIARAARAPGITPVSLRRLAEASPDTALAAVYGRMVQEASLRRTLAGHAGRLASNAARPSTAARATPSGPDPAPGHRARLGSALRQHGHALEPGAPARDAAAAPARTWSGPDDPRIGQEEDVLAGLLQHPGQASEVTAWLPPEAFTPGTTREVYEAIRAITARGEPLTELTVAWELSGSRALAQALGPQAPATSPARPDGDAAYLADLSARPAQATTASTTGQALLASHLRSQIGTGSPSQVGEQVDRPASRPAWPQREPRAAATARLQPGRGRDDRPLLPQPQPDPGAAVNGHRPRP